MFSRDGRERLRTVETQLARVNATLNSSTDVLNSYFSQYTEWHVDFNNGNDSAPGNTRATAIKTLRELVRRVGYNAVFHQHDVTIYTYGTHQADDALHIDWAIFSPNDWSVQRKVLFKHERPAPVHTGTFTAIQARNPATNTPFKVTDPTNAWPLIQPVPRQDPPPPLNTRDGWYLEITSGPRAGAAAWTVQGNDPIVGSAIRTSTWAKLPPASSPFDGLTLLTPQVGDTYAMYQQPRLFIDHIIVSGQETSNTFSGLYFEGYSIYPNYGFDTQKTARYQMFHCIGEGHISLRACAIMGSSWFAAPGSWHYATYMCNCWCVDACVQSGAVMLVDAGACHLGWYATHHAWVYLDAGALGLTATPGATDGGALFIADACQFGKPGHDPGAGFRSTTKGIIYYPWPSFYGANAWWGRPDTQYGVIAEADGTLVVTDTTGITITGNDGDFCVGPVQAPGGPAQAFAMDAATGLPIAPKRICSWANLAATVAAGGFNLIAVDPLSGSAVRNGAGMFV